MTAEDIIGYARQIRECYGTNNPFKICERMGIDVVRKNTGRAGLKGYTTKGICSYIGVNTAYSEISQEIICAHELGHMLFHNDKFNSFAITHKNKDRQVEYEADLFALALLFEDTWFNTPMEAMSAYMIKSVLEHNIELR